ncbi:N-6 DNA methylase [Psychrobacter sp. 4Dc]|uniref:type I restriction-modification system subunit M n=1 Tax=Psychrobacter sp. 4Dc TaxID=888437 RepID=UPI000CC113FD|nr:class I SAM-dependent DNA methyltransferase [Psychrobacter sp. 4Dc]PKH65728.1 N-6 DNA methylase [Psychrobacter sp. 4Dc]
MNLEEIKKLEDQLWEAADTLRANTDLKPNEYATPVLGLIFLKFSDNKYAAYEEVILAEFEELQGTRRAKNIEDIAIKHCGFYLPPKARYKYLLELPESADLATEISNAMQSIENFKKDDKFVDVLPKDEYAAFSRLEEGKKALKGLLRSFSNIPTDASGDVFGRIYEYFLGKFALSEGQKGGEFFTPTSVVKLMVEVIEPYHGTVYDPACGSGGMFVQSLHFVEHRNDQLKAHGELEEKDSTIDLSVYGQEKTRDTVKLAKMNLFVNGLRGEIKQANSYSEDPFESYENFDFIMANPPFNVDDVAIATVENDKRFNTYGLPRKKTKNKKTDGKDETVTNANYLWISLFATSLKNQTEAEARNSGRAALVMPNSASDARNAEEDIRKQIIEDNLIYGMLTLPSNMFYTVSLPATLWFFDKNKTDDNILFIDTRNIFRQIDKTHRDFTDEQIQNIAMIGKLHKGRRREYVLLIDSYFSLGMQILKETVSDIEPAIEHLKAVVADDRALKATVDMLNDNWHALSPLQCKYQAYLETHDMSQITNEDIDALNIDQIGFLQAFRPFFKALQENNKQLDKGIRQKEKANKEQVALIRQELTDAKEADDKKLIKEKDTALKVLTVIAAEIKAIKELLAIIRDDRKRAEYYFNHIEWLQQRFPKARYEDVTGLCKLATPEEVKEQDYSLNTGRYVGVVIEEDGRTEEEFIEYIQEMSDELLGLNEKAKHLESVLNTNINQILGIKSYDN